jgi:hypothetical protein
MLLRRIYEVTAGLIALFGMICIVGGFINAVSGKGFDALLLGLVVGGFAAAVAFVTWQFASGPAVAGVRTLGVEEKAEIMKAESLKRKPPKAAAR